MERQKPTTDLKHNDDFSKALVESYGRWMSGGGFGHHMLQEEGIPAEMKQGPESPTREGGADASTSIPDLSGKEEKSDEGAKDIKAMAGAPDPATDLRVGAGVKQSHGAEIKDTTKVVARESCGDCPECGGKGCSKCQKEDKKMKKKRPSLRRRVSMLISMLRESVVKHLLSLVARTILLRMPSRSLLRLLRKKHFPLNSMALSMSLRK